MGNLTAESRDQRLLRVFLRNEVKAGGSLGDLIEQDHPVVQGVRVFLLVKWLYWMGEERTTRMVRGLPGHVYFRCLTPGQRATLLERVRAYEGRKIRHHR